MRRPAAHIWCNRRQEGRPGCALLRHARAALRLAAPHRLDSAARLHMRNTPLQQPAARLKVSELHT